jgi:hypothetical protein
MFLGVSEESQELQSSGILCCINRSLELCSLEDEDTTLPWKVGIRIPTETGEAVRTTFHRLLKNDCEVPLNISENDIVINLRNIFKLSLIQFMKTRIFKHWLGDRETQQESHTASP